MIRREAMTEPTMETLARRVDRVERENRWLKLGGVVALTVIAAVVLMGCSGVTKVKYSPLTSIDRPPRSIDRVEVFTTKEPTKPYVEVGVLSYRAVPAENYTDAVQYMRAKAALLGLDGIIILGSSAGPSVPVGHVIATLTDYRAMAIVYTE